MLSTLRPRSVRREPGPQELLARGQGPVLEAWVSVGGLVGSGAGGTGVRWRESTRGPWMDSRGGPCWGEGRVQSCWEVA